MDLRKLRRRAVIYAAVENEVVFDAELFEEPEDALGLGVLVIQRVRGKAEDEAESGLTLR